MRSRRFAQLRTGDKDVGGVFSTRGIAQYPGKPSSIDAYSAPYESEGSWGGGGQDPTDGKPILDSRRAAV